MSSEKMDLDTECIQYPSVFYSGAGLDPAVVGMLDELHLGHVVGVLLQGGGDAASGHDHLDVGGSGFQSVDEVGVGDQLHAYGIYRLVHDHHVVRTGPHELKGPVEGGAGRVDVLLLGVLGHEMVQSEAEQLHVRELPAGQLFAVAVGGLQELHDEDVEAPACGTERKPEGRGGLPLAALVLRLPNKSSTLFALEICFS